MGNAEYIDIEQSAEDGRQRSEEREQKTEARDFGLV
jgi:hypothetical protein